MRFPSDLIHPNGLQRLCQINVFIWEGSCIWVLEVSSRVLQMSQNTKIRQVGRSVRISDLRLTFFLKTLNRVHVMFLETSSEGDESNLKHYFSFTDLKRSLKTLSS